MTDRPRTTYPDHAHRYSYSWDEGCNAKVRYIAAAAQPFFFNSIFFNAPAARALARCRIFLSVSCWQTRFA